MSSPRAKHDRDDAWGVTLAFWGTLLAAGALFAAVSLAPRLKALADLDAEYAANQLRLVELERRAADLEKVADALEHDPAFAAELAKLEFAAGGTGEQIDLPPELRLGGSDQPAAVVPRATAARRLLPPAVLVPLATSRPLRATLLAAAAALALAAFVLLHERHAAAARVLGRSVAATAYAVTSRYQKGEPERSSRRPSRRAA